MTAFRRFEQDAVLLYQSLYTLYERFGVNAGQAEAFALYPLRLVLQNCYIPGIWLDRLI